MAKTATTMFRSSHDWEVLTLEGMDEEGLMLAGTHGGEAAALFRREGADAELAPRCGWIHRVALIREIDKENMERGSSRK